jgi:putative FmdB family regulatory protein
MPFYEYECSNCKFYCEVMQKITDAPLKKCPSCKKSTLTKLVSAPVFRLKGGGWYETDFKSEKEGKRNLAESATSDKEDKPAPAAADAKPAETKAAEPKAAAAKPAAKAVSSARKSAARKPAARRHAPAKKTARKARRR